MRKISEARQLKIEHQAELLDVENRRMSYFGRARRTAAAENELEFGNKEEGD